MERKGEIQLFTNIDGYASFEALFRSSAVTDLDQTQKGLVNFGLKAGREVRFQISRRGKIQIWFQEGSNLVEAWKKIVTLGVPMEGDRVSGIFIRKNLSEDLQTSYDLLKAFIGQGYRLNPDPQVARLLREFGSHYKEGLLTAASLVALEIALGGQYLDHEAEVMDKILDLLRRTYERALHGSGRPQPQRTHLNPPRTRHAANRGSTPHGDEALGPTTFPEEAEPSSGG